MKTLGISFVIILLAGSLVSPIGILSAFAIVPTIPLSPTHLNATAVTGTKIFLIWNSPIDATQDGVIGYKIDISPSCSGSFSFLANTTAPSFFTMGLINGTCYQFRVSAINSIGISSPSNIATATTLSVPSSPTNIAASAVSSSRINLSWNAPSNNGGTQIMSYNILKNLCSESSVIIIHTHNTTTTYSDTGLSANTCYKYNVEAVNAIGPGPSAINNATAVTNGTLQIHTSGAPIGLSVAIFSNTSLKLTWHKPANNGGAPITGYLIQRNGTTYVSNTFTNQTIFTDTNLLPNHRETYTVAAWNNVGLGAFSNQALAITNSSLTLPGTSGNITTSINGSANLGQLISDFVHKRNALLQLQRADVMAAILECHAQMKNATSDDRKQVHDECKAKVKELREKFKESRKQLQDEFKQLRAIFKITIQEDKIKLVNATGKIRDLNEDIKESEKESKDESNKTGAFKQEIEEDKIKLANASSITHDLKKELKQLEKAAKHSGKGHNNKGKSGNNSKDNNEDNNEQD